jgi:hypothetical protein
VVSDLVQIVIEQRKQSVERFVVTRTPLGQQLGDSKWDSVAHSILFGCGLGKWKILRNA